MEMAKLLFLTKENLKQYYGKKQRNWQTSHLPLTVRFRNFGLISSKTQPSILSPKVQRLGRKVYQTRHVVLGLRMSGAIPSLHKYAFMECAGINIILPP